MDNSDKPIKTKEQMEYEIYEMIYSLRGNFIERCITLEMRMNVFLANHYAKNKKLSDDLLRQLFLTEKITWNNKIELFDTIIIGYYSETFGRFNPKFLCELKDIIKHRNNLAHLHVSLASLPDDLKKGQLNLLKSNKKQLSSVEYTVVEINRLYDLLDFYSTQMDQLLEEQEKLHPIN